MARQRGNVRAGLGLAAVAILAAGCGVYYKTMEAFGYHKRDLLVGHVKEARTSQAETKEQFRSALARFRAVVDVPAGELAETYDELKAEYEKSAAKAEEVRERIAAVEEVSAALFAEWEAELEQYRSDRLREKSARQLTATRKRCAQLLGKMKAAEKTIEPVLSVLRDQVLFLKHNLNAQAVASLQEELVSVEADVETLVQQMNEAIEEADSFIQGLEQNSAAG
jgi:hypothetical protein